MSKRPLNPQCPLLMTAELPESTGSCHGDPRAGRPLGGRGWDPALASSNFWGAEARIRLLRCLSWLPSGPPYLLGEKLSPREPSAPTPAKPSASQVGVGPSIGLRTRGVFRGVGVHGSFPFALMRVATLNTSCCPGLTPKLPGNRPCVRHWG